MDLINLADAGNNNKIVLKGNFRGNNKRGNMVISSRSSNNKLVISLNGVKNNAPKDGQQLVIKNDMPGGFLSKIRVGFMIN